MFSQTSHLEIPSSETMLAVQPMFPKFAQWVPEAVQVGRGGSNKFGQNNRKMKDRAIFTTLRGTGWAALLPASAQSALLHVPSSFVTNNMHSIERNTRVLNLACFKDICSCDIDNPL